MSSRFFIITIYIASILFYNRVPAQDLNFFHYSVDQGLPSSQVHDIIQDKYGNLWFSTDQGLSRYDGYDFRNFTTNDGLTDNILFKFYPQENGEIGCTTFNRSVFFISGANPVFKPYPFNKTLVNIPDQYISLCLYIAKDRSLFMSMVSGSGYIHIDEKGKTIHNSIGPPDKVNESVLLTDGGGQDFFFINSEKLPEETLKNFRHIIHCPKKTTSGYMRACFFQKTKQGVFINSLKHLFIVGNRANDTLHIPTLYEPISLGKLNDTLFWVGFRYGGVGIFDLSGKQVQSFLPGKSVTKLYIDHEGGYWLSTLNDGVYHSSNISVKRYVNNETATGWVNALARDSSRNLWIGNYNGDVSVLSENKIVHKYTSAEKRPALLKYDTLTRKVYFITDYRLFISGKKVSGFDLGTNPLNFYIHRNDSVLIASYSAIYILNRGKRTQLKTGFRITDICSQQNDLYLGSLKGLYKIRGQKIIPVNNDSLLVSAKISDIDPWGKKLFIGTRGSGLLILENNKVSRIDKKSGLSSNIINKIYIENDTVLWACTNSGLNHIVLKNKKVSRIDIISNQNGLISNEVTSMEVIKDTVWVGTREGLCYFPRSMLYKENRDISYYLKLTGLKVNDSTRQLTVNTCLKYYENRVEFNFSAASFSEFAPLLYRYKLAEIETKWNYTNARSILYSSLPAGTYTFIIQVRGNNALWEKGEQKFSFTILPPWWKTWWFTISVFVLLVTLIYLFFRFRILSYNRDITRELLRQLLKRLSKKTHFVVFKEQGKEIRIPAGTICFIKASGNYIEIQTDIKKYVVRYKISEFLKLVPDPLEYLRVNRSCIVRLDKIQEKSKKNITVRGETIPIGETYTEQLQKIKF